MNKKEHHKLGDAINQLCHGIDNAKVIAALGMVMSRALSKTPEKIGIEAMAIIIQSAYPDAKIELKIKNVQ